jgi:hypothetical protein
MACRFDDLDPEEQAGWQVSFDEERERAHGQGASET